MLLLFNASLNISHIFASPGQFSTPMILCPKEIHTSEEFRLSPNWKATALTYDQAFSKKPLPPHSPFAYLETTVLYDLEGTGKTGWKYWFEPVDEDIESSKNLRLYLEKSVDDGPWERVLATAIPKNKPTIYKRFIDEFIPPHTKIFDRSKRILLSRNIYRFVIENPNDHDVYVFKKADPELSDIQGKKYVVNYGPSSGL